MPRTPGSKQVPIQIREYIIQLRIAGVKNKEIAVLLGLSESTTTRIYKHYLTTNSLNSSPHPGRPSKLSPRNQRALKNSIKKNRQASLVQLTSEIPIKCHLNTIRKTIHKLGYNSYIARKKPFLNSKHMKIRLEWAKTWLT
jgi:transposase